MKLKKKVILKTSGDGYWSDECRSVEIFAIDNGDFHPNELCLYFTKKSWDVDKHGLIYTDSGFLKEFRKYLVANGLPKELARDIDYTEQGMQGEDYVSLEYGPKTAKYLLSKLGAF